MARSTKQSFWSYITRRRGGARPPARPTAPVWSRWLTLERLEDRTVPSVTFGADPINNGKSIVTFTDDTANGVALQLRLSGGQLQYKWDAGSYSSDLNTTAGGVQPLNLSQISKIVVGLNGGGDTLTLDNANGSVIPVPSGIVYDGGDGTDALVYGQAADMVLTNGSLTVAGVGTVALASVERADLTCGNFGNSMNAAAFGGDVTLTGGNGRDTLTGGSGNDGIHGLNGADVLNGGPGNDTVDGSQGPDTVTGGPGNDTIVGGDASTDTLVEARNAHFRLTDTGLTLYHPSDPALTSPVEADVLVGIEHAVLTGGGSGNVFSLTGWTRTAALDGVGGIDTLVLSQATNMTLTDALLTRGSGGSFNLTSVERATLTGGAGGNTLNAAAFTGNATLTGGGGPDVLVGGSGGDRLTGGGGQNSLTGGPGIDTVVESGDVDFTLSDTLLTFGTATDILSGIEQAELTGGASVNQFTLTGWTGDADIGGGGGADAVTNTGSNLASIHAADFSSFVNEGNNIGTIDLSGADFSSFLNSGDFVGTIDLRGAVFDSLINTGEIVQTIDLTGAVFDTLVNTIDGDNVALIDLTGADFTSFVNAGDAVQTIDLTGAVFDTLVNTIDGDNVALIDLAGADFTSFFNAGDAVETIDLGGAVFDTLVNTGDLVQTIDLTGAVFDSLVNGGELVQTIDLTGAIFDTLVNTIDGDNVALIDLTGAVFDSLVNAGDAVQTIDLTGAVFDTLVNTGDLVQTIDLSGAVFDTLVNSGDGAAIAVLEIDLTGADFGSLVNGGDFAEIDATGAQFGSLINDGDYVTAIALDGADFGRFTTDGTHVSNISATAASFETITIDGADVSNVVIVGDDGPNVLVIGGSGVTNVVFNGGGGDDVFAVTGTDVTAATANGDDGRDTFYVGGGTVALTLAGGGGDDRYLVGTATLGQLDIVEGYAGAGDTSVDALDFSGYTPAGVALDLELTGWQTLAPGLSLKLSDALGVEDVVGTAWGDAILGNGRNNRLLGADQRDDRYGAPPAWNLRTQVVVLDFDTFTNQDPVGGPFDSDTGEHDYTGAERQAIEDRLDALYAGFHVDFRVAPNVGSLPADYATVYFNRSRFDIVGGQLQPPEPGGDASDLDFRNTYLGGTATVQVNGLLGGSGQPDAGSPNFVAASAWVAAHELGHLLGLRHSDAFGPIGFGVYNPPATGSYIPSFPGPAAAFETNAHLLASPAITGFDLNDLVSDTFFGEREAVKLAFAVGAPLAPDGQMLVAEQGDHGTFEAATPLALYSLAVPNTLHRGVNANKAFAVAAVGVVGAIDALGQKDVYSFHGRAGDLLSLEVLSRALVRNGSDPDVVDSVVTVYDSSGQVIATNDDQFERPDSTLIDVVLPADGLYYVEVRAFAGYPIIDVSTGDDESTGDYELFVYRFDAANVGDLGDVLSGRGGDDVLTGGTGANALDGGTGVNAVVESGDGNFSLAGTMLTGPGTATLANVQQAVLTGGVGANTFTVVSTWAGTATIDGGDGVNVLVGAGANNVWTVAAPDAGTLAGAGTVAFARIANLTGGALNDVFAFADGQGVSGVVNGGGGVNALNYSAYSAAHSVAVNLAAGTATGTGGLTVGSIRNVTGGAGNDTLVGDGQINALAGGLGDDALTGGLGNDTLDGGLGTDTLTEQGNVNFTLTNTSLAGLGADVLVSINKAELTGGAGANAINAAAFAGDAVMRGLGGNDTLTGGAGHDVLDGGDNNDTLTSGAGTNVLIGGAGDDTLTGSAGTNVLIGGTGADTLSGSANNDILIAGHTAWDANYVALRAILAEWASADSHAVRVGNISGPYAGGSHLNGTYYLNATTVFTDASIDKLSASGGTDWYFVDLDGADGTPKDKITGNPGSSTIIGIFPPP